MRHSSSPSPIRSPTYFKRVHLDSTEYHGIFWSILFIANLFATFFLCFYIINKTVGFDFVLKLLSTSEGSFYDYLKNDSTINQGFSSAMFYVKKSIKIALVATFIFNIIHMAYAFTFPKLYIRLHLILSLIFCVIPAILLFLPQTSPFKNGENNIWQIVITLVFAALGIFLFFYLQRYVATSAELMKTSVKILSKHPSLFLIEIIQSIFLLLLNIIYLICISAIKESPEAHFTPIIYVYGVFTYYWIIMTTHYVCYMTAAGVIGVECYLGDSKSAPKNPVLFSFKRAITQNLGSAAFAGFILAIIQTLEFLVELLNPNKKKKSDDEEDSKASDLLRLVFAIFYYILSFILSIIKSYFSYISRQALIYCAVYGCSYKEACRRYKKNGFSDKMIKLQHESIISGATGTNYLLIMIFAGLTVYYFQSVVYQYESGIVFTSVLLTVVLMAVFTFTTGMITTTSDTIFLCYLENPTLIHKNHHDLYKKLNKIKY